MEIFAQLSGFERRSRAAMTRSMVRAKSFDLPNDGSPNL